MKYPSNQQVLDQQNAVSRLVIPFEIDGNATPASVVVRSGLPGVLFVATEGLSVSAADASATGLTLVDGAGQFGCLVKLGDSVKQVLGCSLQRPAASGAANFDICALGDADGLSASGNIWLQCDSSVAISAAGTTKFTLAVEYIQQ